MHLALSAPDHRPFLEQEVVRALPSAVLEPVGDSMLALTGTGGWSETRKALGLTAFARQWLPEARPFPVPSIRAAAETLVTELIGCLPDGGPWRLQVEPRWGVADAGRHRCELIGEAVVEQLRKRRRSLLKGLDAVPKAALAHPVGAPIGACPSKRGACPWFQPGESLIQLLLTSPEMAFLSILPASEPAGSRGWVSPFPQGEVPVAVDKAAPSRAFAKLAESELRMDRFIAAGDTCVDLGAAPGSWTYQPVQRGARVIAVDRSPLRDDLMRHPRVTFHQGDAFRFVPETPVDWLLCDVIAAPERSIGLVLDWVRERRCRHFVVTIKFKGQADYAQLDVLKREMPHHVESFQLLHLCSNKNEACVFGTVGDGPLKNAG